MILGDREIKFRRTVLGNCEIAEICPDKDINNFAQLVESDYVTAQMAAAAFISALNKGYEMWRQYEDPGYKPNPISAETVMLLDSDDFNSLFMEAMAAFTADGKATVEAEGPKQTKKNAEAAGSD